MPTLHQKMLQTFLQVTCWCNKNSENIHGHKTLTCKMLLHFFSTHNSNNCRGNVCILVWSDSTPISVSCKVLLGWRKSSCCAACGLWQHMLEAVLGFQGQYKYWAVAGGAGNHRPHFCLWLHLSSKPS